jgi:hypothetical protein
LNAFNDYSYDDRQEADQDKCFGPINLLPEEKEKGKGLSYRIKENSLGLFMY